MMLMPSGVVGSVENENDVIVVCLSARCTPFHSPCYQPSSPFSSTATANTSYYYDYDW
jgi:hypothetical protein